MRSGPHREDAIVELYRERMRAAGGFTHVTSTRILKPTHDRSYFYLVYGTRHFKGLVEFRGVEKKVVEEQERVRLTAKQESRETRTGQPELFAAGDTPGLPPAFEDERSRQMVSALARLRALLSQKRKVIYEDALANLLELPLVWESDVKGMIMKMRDSDEVDVIGLKPRERTPKKGHVVVWKGQP